MSHQAIRLCLQGTGRIFDWLKIHVFQCSVHTDSGGPGEGHSRACPPLLLDQTKARKKFLGDCPNPLWQGLDDPPPPTLIWRFGSATDRTSLTVWKFRCLPLQSSVWTWQKYLMVPCGRSVRSNLLASRKFVRYHVNVASVTMLC